MTDRLDDKTKSPEPHDKKTGTTAGQGKAAEKRPRGTLFWMKATAVGVLATLGASALLLSTPAVQRWITVKGLSFVDGLEVKRVAGDWSDLTLEGVRFAPESGLVVDLESAHLDFAWSTVLKKTWTIEEIALKGLSVDATQMKPSPEKTDSKPLGPIDMPVGVRLAKLSLENTSVKAPGLDAGLASLSAAASFGPGEKGLVVERFATEGLSVVVSKTDEKPEEKSAEQTNDKTDAAAGVKTTTGSGLPPAVSPAHPMGGKSAKAKKTTNDKAFWTGVLKDLPTIDIPIAVKVDAFAMTKNTITIAGGNAVEQANPASTDKSGKARKTRKAEDAADKPLVIPVDALTLEGSAFGNRADVHATVFVPGLQLDLRTDTTMAKGWNTNTRLAATLHDIERLPGAQRFGLADFARKDGLPEIGLALTAKGRLSEKFTLDMAAVGSVRTHVEAVVEQGGEKIDVAMKANTTGSTPVLGHYALVDDLDFSLKGTPEKLVLDAHGAAKWLRPELAPVSFLPFSLKLTATKEAVELEEVSLKSLPVDEKADGRTLAAMKAKGRITLGDEPGGTLSLALDRLNLNPWLYPFFGKKAVTRENVVTGVLDVSAMMKDVKDIKDKKQKAGKELSIDIARAELKGGLLGSPLLVDTKGRIEKRLAEAGEAAETRDNRNEKAKSADPLEGLRLELPVLRLEAFGSRIDGHAGLDTGLVDVALTGRIPSLKSITDAVPVKDAGSATGSIDFDVKASGDPVAPTVKALVKAADLVWTAPATKTVAVPSPDGKTTKEAPVTARMKRFTLTADLAPYETRMGKRLGGAVTLEAGRAGTNLRPRVRLADFKAELTGREQRHELKIDALVKRLPEDLTKLRKARQKMRAKAAAAGVPLSAVPRTPNPEIERITFTAAVHGSAALDRKTWIGRLDDLKLATPYGEVFQKKGASMGALVEKGRYHLENLVLVTKDETMGVLETTAPILLETKPVKASGAVKLTGVNLNHANAFLEEAGYEIDGTVSGGAVWSVKSADDYKADLHLETDRIAAAPLFAPEGAGLAVEKLAAALSVDPKAARMTMTTDLAPLTAGAKKAPVAFNLSLLDPTERKRLEGRLEIGHRDEGSGTGADAKTPFTGRTGGIDLAWLNPFINAEATLEGDLTADIAVGGAVNDPTLTGRAGVEGFRVETALATLKMEPSPLTIDFKGHESILKGDVITRASHLALDGHAAWEGGKDIPKITALDAHVKGDKIVVGLPSYGSVTVSPDITADFDGKRMKVTGEVGIPEAELNINTLPPSAVGPSDDLVLLNEDLEPETKAESPIPLFMQVFVDLGPDVNVNVFNLAANLAGRLQVNQGATGLAVAGEIRIPEGRFKAYGQDLNITEGRITFAGPPDKPYVNIKAIRNPDVTEDGVTAGLTVEGPASAPEVKVFSDPAMSQAEALSYLLRGQAIGASDGDSGLLASAVLGFGLSQTSQVLDKIGKAVGLRALSVDAVGNGDNTKVVVSATLLPGLEFKYGVGLFDSLMTFTLRYRLFNRMYLEAVTGAAQSLDMLYRFSW